MIRLWPRDVRPRFHDFGKQVVVPKEPAEHLNSTSGGVRGKFQARAARAAVDQEGRFHDSGSALYSRFRRPAGTEIVRQNAPFGLTIPATGDGHLEH